MRFEKFTTKLQEALAEAQSNALGQDHQYIEPQHLLLALLNQEDGGVAGLISKAGGNPNALKKALSDSIARLPKVEGTPGEVMLSRDLAQLLNVADKEAQKRGDQYIASELFLLAAAADKGEIGRLLKSAGVTRQSLEKAIEEVRGGEAISSQSDEGQRQALAKYTLDLVFRSTFAKSSALRVQSALKASHSSSRFSKVATSISRKRSTNSWRSSVSRILVICVPKT